MSWLAKMDDYLPFFALIMFPSKVADVQTVLTGLVVKQWAPMNTKLTGLKFFKITITTVVSVSLVT